MADFFNFAIVFYSSNESNNIEYEIIYENMMNFLMMSFCQIKSEAIKEVSEMSVWKSLICKLISDLSNQIEFVVDSTLKILMCITFFSNSISLDIFLDTPIFSVLSEMIETNHIHLPKIFRVINNFCLSGDKFTEAILNESQLVYRIMKIIDTTSFAYIILEEGLHTIRNILRQIQVPALIPFCIEHFTMWDIIYTKINRRIEAKYLIHVHDILESLYQIGDKYAEDHLLEDNLFVNRISERNDLKDLLELAQCHPDEAIYEKFYKLITKYFNSNDM